MNAHGRVYIGLEGDGYVYGDTSSAQIPPIVSSVSSGAMATSSTITWTTDQSSNSEVVYGTTANYGSSSSNASLTTSHSITLTSLNPGTTYHYAVVSANSQGYTATSTDQTFTTNDLVLSNIASSTTYTSATVTWNTNENASSEVVYGTTTSYGSASSTAALVASHTIVLTGLTPSSTYHFAVVSTDANGLTSTSSDQTFATPATSTPPAISNIASSTGTTYATITWTTDQSSNSEVAWGLTASYGSASSSAALVTSHSITVSGLATSTTYHFAVVSANTFGATATSSDQTFTTPATSTPLALDGNSFFTSAVTSISTDVTLTTAYANDVIILNIAENGTSVNSVSDTDGLTWHQRAIAGTAPNLLYEYYALATGSLSADTITVSFTGGGANYDALNAFGISGANTSTPFDTNASIPTAADSGQISVNTTNADDFIFAAYRFGGTANPTAGSGWTAVNASGGYYLSEYQAVTSAQTGLTALTSAPFDENGGVVDAVVEAAP